MHVVTAQSWLWPSSSGWSQDVGPVEEGVQSDIIIGPILMLLYVLIYCFFFEVYFVVYRLVYLLKYDQICFMFMWWIKKCTISIVKSTRCTNVSNLFISEWTLRVSDGLSVRHQGFKTVRTSKQILLSDVCLVASRQQTAVSVWRMAVAACTVLISWWWTERPSETCRASFQNKIILYIGASCWFYYRNNITIHGHMNVNAHL